MWIVYVSCWRIDGSRRWREVVKCEHPSSNPGVSRCLSQSPEVKDAASMHQGVPVVTSDSLPPARPARSPFVLRAIGGPPTMIADAGEPESALALLADPAAGCGLVALPA